VSFKMDQIVSTFDNLNLKARNAEEAMLVLSHKSELRPEIIELSGSNKEIKKLQAEMKQSIDDHNNILKNQYKDTTEVIGRVQMKMMLLLEHIEGLEKKRQSGTRALKEINIPGTPRLYERDGAAQAFSELNTPRMMLSEYAKSPFTKKRTKVQLHFADFEAEMTNEDFLKIPAYMKGRVTLSELQDFLDNVVIRTFNEKYQLMFKQRNTLKPTEFSLQNMFKDQASYFEGSKFITVGDIARILEKNVDKKDDRFLQMLRHLQIIREARKSSICCYIWLK
jgi:Spindle and kinetochore-associated protein 1